MSNKLKISDIDMRDAFFDSLYDIARKDKNLIFLTADMGAHSLVRFKRDLNKQFINVGIAEQNMVSVAAGLALGGKKVFIYTIIPFATLRCYEQIKVDLCCMNLPVTIVGMGAGLAYGSDGPTHHAIQDIAVMRTLPKMMILNPSDHITTAAFARMAYESREPTYIRIDKGKLPRIHDINNKFKEGLEEIRAGSDLAIITTGFMTHRAYDIADKLMGTRMSCGIVDTYRIKPLNHKLLLKIIDKYKYIVTLEENTVIGGLGSAIAEIMNDNKCKQPLYRMALPDEHCFMNGDRQYLLEQYDLSAEKIVVNIRKWLGI